MHTRILSVSFAVLTFLAVGCGGSEAEIDDGEGVDLASEGSELTKSVDGYYHYQASVQDVRYAAGCGIVRPGMPPCYSGVLMTFTRNYADLKYTVKATVNQASKTITIRLDTYSAGQIHSMMMVRPQDEQLGSLNLNFGTTYKVKVVDYHQQRLFTGTLTPMLAM